MHEISLKCLKLLAMLAHMDIDILIPFFGTLNPGNHSFLFFFLSEIKPLSFILSRYTFAMAAQYQTHGNRCNTTG